MSSLYTYSGVSTNSQQANHRDLLDNMLYSYLYLVPTIGIAPMIMPSSVGYPVAIRSPSP
jgi:hypothetical protein